jgi:hypothetical protein
MSVAAIVVGLVLASTVTPVQSAGSTPMRFGADMDSLERASRKNLPMAFGTFWVGSWTARHGWGYAESQLRAAKQRNVTPVINWWYWGDDISPQCVEQGCRDARQNVAKDKATWYRMSNELAALIDRTMGARETIVVLETEFNKGGIETFEPFDGYLADLAKMFHSRGNVKVVIGFGNWGRSHWSRFDRAVAAADYVGTQLLQSSVRDASTYAGAVDTLITGARFAQDRFHKPSFIVDLALSSYPAASYEARQAAVTRELFTRMPELKAAGVRGILYRMIADDPKFDASNYHGVAERHWGLLRADGSEKPAFAAFAAGVRREARAN